jgi:hypothetical protein
MQHVILSFGTLNVTGKKETMFLTIKVTIYATTSNNVLHKITTFLQNISGTKIKYIQTGKIMGSK